MTTSAQEIKGSISSHGKMKGHNGKGLRDFQGQIVTVDADLLS